MLYVELTGNGYARKEKHIHVLSETRPADRICGCPQTVPTCDEIEGGPLNETKKQCIFVTQLAERTWSFKTLRRASENSALPGAVKWLLSSAACKPPNLAASCVWK